MKYHFSGKKLLTYLLATTLLITSAPVTHAEEPHSAPSEDSSTQNKISYFQLGAGRLSIFPMKYKGYIIACMDDGQKRYVMGDDGTNHPTLLTSASDALLRKSRCKSISDCTPLTPGTWLRSVDIEVKGGRLPEKTADGKRIKDIKAVQPINLGRPCVQGASASVPSSRQNCIDSFTNALSTGLQGYKVFNWDLNDSKLSYVACSLNTGSLSALGFDTRLKYMPEHGFSITNFTHDATTRKFSYTYSVPLEAALEGSEDSNYFYKPIIESAKKCQQVLQKDPLHLSAAQSKKTDNTTWKAYTQYKTNLMAAGLPDKDIQKRLNDLKVKDPSENGYELKDPSYKTWCEYWLSSVANSQKILQSIWTTGKTSADVTEGSAGKVIYLPHCIQWEVENEGTNLLLSEVPIEPVTSQGTTVKYNQTTQTLSITPLGEYEVGEFDKVDAFVKADITVEGGAQISGQSSLSFQWDPISMDKGKGVLFPTKDLPVTPDTSAESTVTIKLEINPEPRNPKETIPSPKKAYKDNVLIYTIKIRPLSTEHNLAALSFLNLTPDYASAIESGDGSKYRITAKVNWAAYNAIDSYFPQILIPPTYDPVTGDIISEGGYSYDTNTTYVAKLYYHRTPGDPSEDPSNLIQADSIDASNIPVPCGMVYTSGIADFVFRNVKSDYTGYATASFYINNHGNRPTNETTMTDNVITATIFLQGLGNHEHIPAKFLVSGNDRVTKQMPIELFQIHNTQDLKHDGIPHAEGVTPIEPDNTSTFYQLCNGGKFTDDVNVSWSSEKTDENYSDLELHSSTVPSPATWGEPTLVYEDFMTGFCSVCGSKGSTCSVCGHKDSDCPHTHSTEEAYKYVKDHQKYTNFVYYDDKYLFKATPRKVLKVMYNVPMLKIVYQCPCSYETHTTWTTDIKDSDGDVIGHEEHCSHRCEGSVYKIVKLKEPVNCTFSARFMSVSGIDISDYDSGTKQTKAGYGFKCELQGNFITDYHKDGIYCLGYAQFPYFSNRFSELPWEVSWLEPTAKSTSSTVLEFRKNAKDEAKQPIGYRYSMFSFREHFIHTNYPDGGFNVWYNVFLNLVPYVVYYDDHQLTQGNGTSPNDPVFVIGNTTGNTTQNKSKMLPFKALTIGGNMWDDSFVSGEGATVKSSGGGKSSSEVVSGETGSDNSSDSSGVDEGAPLDEGN